jgi:hypothetical protein
MFYFVQNATDLVAERGWDGMLADLKLSCADLQNRHKIML